MNPSEMQVKSLDPAQFARLSALLDDALGQPTGEREAWLAALAARDPEAGAHVRALLRSLSAAQSERLFETGEFIASRFAAAVQTAEPLAGRQIGPYRVLQAIGYGGMGMVWLAERADGLFERKVALKLVHPSLMGTALTERFARERAILAGLEHPNIARLLDAGFTPERQPYLALEYVDGVPLTEYCDRQRLAVRARIAILLQALRAVQFAHANLVIHRDLKPSNILVTSEGQVKLLDFGIAKLLTEGEAKETELTALSGRAFTPDYASPEQITGAPITTASDVYSLGVVLYELLCGQRPYQLKRETRGALEDAIIAAEPSRPSGAGLSDAAAEARSTGVRKLAQTLRGDLDSIALKALKKHPGGRYATVEALAQDLERYLHDERVLARPDHTYYRLSRFVARHKIVVGAACATTLALALGLAAALWQAGVARDQAAFARNEATRATAVQDFLIDLFRENSVEQPDPAKARQTTARELLDLGGKRVDESLKSAPEARADVLGTLADMYYQLGMYEEAAKEHGRAVDAFRQAYGPNDSRVAEALIAYAADIANLPERSQVLPALEEARQVLDRAHDDTSETRGKLLMNLAQANRYTAIDKMRAYADGAVTFFREHYPQSPNLSLALAYAASARMQQGDAEGAEALFRQALAEVVRRDGTQSAWSVFPLIGLAEVEDALGKVDEAEASYRSALAAAQARFGEFHSETMMAEVKLGAYLYSTARRDEGNRWMEKAVADVGKGKGGYTPPYVIAVLSGVRSRAILPDGRLEEAARLIAVDLDDARENFPGSAPLAGALRAQIALDVARGRYEDATKALEEALQVTQSIGANGAPALRNRLLLERTRLQLARGDAAAAIETLGSIAPPAYSAKLPLRVQEISTETLRAEAFVKQGRFAEAIASARNARDQIVASPLRKYYPLLEADAALRLGEAQRRAGDAGGARPNLERALQLRAENNDPKSPWLAEAEIALAACLLDLGERRRAVALLAKARAIDATHPQLAPHLVAPPSNRSARLASR